MTTAILLTRKRQRQMTSITYENAVLALEMSHSKIMLNEIRFYLDILVTKSAVNSGILETEGTHNEVHNIN